MLSTCDPDTGAPVAYTANAEMAHALPVGLGGGFLESEERFRQIVEGLQDIVALTDVKGDHLYFVNAAYEQTWGRPRKELYEDPMAFLEGVHPDDRARVLEVMFRLPRKEFDLEFRVIRPGGEQRWVWSRGVPVRDASGRIYRIASITEDVTERKAIAESHERLLRGFTHDVKNPLGAADGYLSLLELGVYGAMPAAQLETIGRARRTIGAALGLVSQLLDIERAKAGQLLVERERVDLVALARDCIEDFRSAASARRQRIALQNPAEGDSLIVESDRVRVRQILANLVSNAVKYTPPEGSIVVSARVADDSETRQGPMAALAVMDNGPGIPPEKQRLLFREFTRLDPGAAEGSGIGLAISQHIAHALGGSITFRSTFGGGSTFTLWLPRGTSP
jgi:PAS domain S-box-containing protein